MKKLFVILSAIVLTVLSGCKPALPGAVISIENAIESRYEQPETYELNILYDGNGAERAFHMKNIGANLTSARTIVLENISPAIYVAEVNAFKGEEKVGYGRTNFMPSADADVTVFVEHWVKPYSTWSKKITFTEGSVDRIVLQISNAAGIIDTKEYTDLADKAEFTTDGKVNIENVNATFKWTLFKDSYAVASFTDRLEKLEDRKDYALEENSIGMSMTSSDKTASYGQENMTRAFRRLQLEVLPSEDLRKCTSAFIFEFSAADIEPFTEKRNINEENNYLFDKMETGTYEVKITPVMQDGTTELRAASTTVTSSTNIPLTDVRFSIPSGEENTYRVELGDSITFDIARNPEEYTKFRDGRIVCNSPELVDIAFDGKTVTVTPSDIGKDIQISYEEDFQPFLDSDYIFIESAITEPVLSIKTSGSRITLSWNYVHPEAELILHSTINGDETSESIPHDDSNIYKTSINKNTKASYYLEVRFKDLDPIFSNEVSYETGEYSYVSIILPEMKDMDIVFQQSMDISGVIEKEDRITFTLDTHQNTSIRKVYWMVNNQVAQESVCPDGEHTDEFVFYSANENIHLDYGTGIVPQEIVVAVETADGRLFSKNINLNLNMENIIL